MAVPNIIVTLGGTNYPIPQPGSTPWGQNVTNWIIAASGSTGFVQLGGGTQALAADLNFGASFGLISIYYKSHSANIAASGLLRAANSDVLIGARNVGNTADDQLIVGQAANSQPADALLWKNATSGNTTLLTDNPYAEYNTTAGQSIPNNASTVINYATLVTDTDSAVTTGAAWKFTVPTNKGGIYLVAANATLSAPFAGTTPFTLVLQLLKNAGEVARLYFNVSTANIGAASFDAAEGSTLVNCVPGDTLTIGIIQSSTAGAAIALSTISFENRITIKRIS